MTFGNPCVLVFYSGFASPLSLQIPENRADRLLRYQVMARTGRQCDRILVHLGPVLRRASDF